MSSTSGPTPDQLRDRNRRKRAQLERDVRDLLEKLSFTDALKEVSDANAALTDLRSGLSDLRARGYLFRAELEPTLDRAEAAAPDILTQVQRETAQASRDWRSQVERLQQDVAGLSAHDLIAIGPLLEKHEDDIEGVEKAMGEVERRVDAIAEPLLTPARTLKKAIKDLSWTLERFDKGAFDLRPEENPVACAKATWTDAPGGDDKPGFLLFTDHRLRFEHVEEKVTKRKLLFFAAEKEEIQELVLDEPVGHLDSSTDQTSGLIIKDQLLVLRWDRKADCPDQTTFELDGGKATDWDAVVERLMKGDLERDMIAAAAAPRPDVHGVPVEWPEKCDQCGANLDAPVKGQTTIICAYCAAEHDVVMGQG